MIGDREAVPVDDSNSMLPRYFDAARLRRNHRAPAISSTIRSVASG